MSNDPKSVAERLRKAATALNLFEHGATRTAMFEAADLLGTLTHERDEAREALRPFAEVFAEISATETGTWTLQWRNERGDGGGSTSVTKAIYAARRALKAKA